MTAIKSLYFSYAHPDTAFVTPLRDALTAQGIKLGFNDKQAPDNPKSGWNSALRYKMPESYAIMVVLSPASAQWAWYTPEIEQAQRHRVPIFVVRLAEVSVHLPALTVPDLNLKHIDLFPADRQRLAMTQLLNWLVPLQAATDSRHLLPLLQAVVDALPQTRWGLLMSDEGWVHALYQRTPAPEEDRMTAMSGAYLAMAHKMAHDMALGAARYTFLAGEHGFSLTMLLGEIWVLTLCFENVRSYDAIFAQLPALLQPICDFYNVPTVPEKI